MIIDNENNNNSSCPVCRITLSFTNSNEQRQYCNKRTREFYPTKNDHLNKLEYDDIESVSNDYDNEPVLLCLDDNKQKEQDYLKRKFGNHITVETEIYIPD